MLGYTVLTVGLSKPPTDLKAQCCHARCQPSSKMQLCNLHSRNRSHQAARVCCFAGPRLGLWTVIPCQLIVMIGLDIVYCVTAGKAMYYVYQHTCDGYETHTWSLFWPLMLDCNLCCHPDVPVHGEPLPAQPI